MVPVTHHFDPPKGTFDSAKRTVDLVEGSFAVLRILLRRATHGALVVVAASMIAFAMGHLSGDPLSLMLPLYAPPDVREAMTAQLGLDRSIPMQYWSFVKGAATGDFGRSYVFGADAMSLAVARIIPSLKLALSALALSLIIAVPLGIVAAIRRGRMSDFVARGVALLGQCTPSFYLALILILIFSVRLNWLPPTGGDSLRELVMPAFALALYFSAESTRLLRSSLIEILESDYIAAARARGLSEARIIFAHALRNASLPLVTLNGIQLSVLLGSAIVVESVFAYNGLGFLVWRAIQNRDFLVIQAAVIVMTVAVVVLNSIVDLTYGILDPRVRKRNSFD